MKGRNNNRKNTRARLTQYITMKDGSTRAIFHQTRNPGKPAAKPAEDSNEEKTDPE